MNENEKLEFENLLEKTKFLVLDNLSGHSEPSKISGIEFEAIVSDFMAIAAEGTSFEGRVIRTGAQTFPDILIVDSEFGVEVKVTSSDKWVSTGNSILETTRDRNVEKIYMFFGKLGGEPGIQYRSYDECLSEIVATHSPRYLINMELPEGNSIFSKMNVPYDSFRNNGPISRAQQYYKSQLKEGEQLWWISSDSSDTGDEPSSSLVIKQYREFEPAVKARFVAQVMMLFPEVFTTGSLSYRKAAAFLLSEYGAVHSSVRDEFTAGGTFGIKLDTEPISVPHIYKELYSSANIISELLKSSDDLLERYWGFVPALPLRENSWIERSKTMASGLSSKDDFEKIYRLGLQAAH